MLIEYIHYNLNILIKSYLLCGVRDIIVSSITKILCMCEHQKFNACLYYVRVDIECVKFKNFCDQNVRLNIIYRSEQ